MNDYNNKNDIYPPMCRVENKENTYRKEAQ